MTVRKNIVASVRQKLLNRARSDHRPFNELLQYYAMERFIYRLSQSVHSERFILKGALMLRVWEAPELRPTMDIDMLGNTEKGETPYSEKTVVSQIREILNVKVASDGVSFDSTSIQSERITEDADYHGVRIRFLGTLDTARINMQIDIGFGDVVFPPPEKSELPAMLDFAPPGMLCYSRESAIAEKFEVMVKLGILNSRMKDFYDIWLLSRQFDFDGTQLARAIQLTFEQRGTTMVEEILAFEDSFIAEKKVQWAAFCKRINQEHFLTEFTDIVAHVEKFLSPAADAVRSRQPFSKHWVKANKWC